MILEAALRLRRESPHGAVAGDAFVQRAPGHRPSPSLRRQGPGCGIMVADMMGVPGLKGFGMYIECEVELPCAVWL